MSADYNVTIKITADATDATAKIDALVKQISQMNASITQLTAQIKEQQKQATEEVEKSSNALSYLADKLSFVGRVAAGITVAAIFFQIAHAISTAVQNLKDMEQSLTIMAALEANTAQQFHELRGALIDTAMNLSARFGVSVKEAADALVSLIKAGVEASEAMKIAGDVMKFAAIDMTDAGTATKNLIMVMAQFAMPTEQATRAMTALVNMSRLGIGTATDFARGLGNAGSAAHLLGVSLEEAGAFMVVLERRLGSADEAGTRFNRALRELYDAATQFGVAIRDSAGHLRPAVDIIMDITEKVREFARSGDFDLLERKFTGLDERARQFFTTLATVPADEFKQVLEEMKTSLSSLDIVYVKTLDTSEERSKRMAVILEQEVTQKISDAWHRVAYETTFSLGMMQRNMETLIIHAYNLADTMERGPTHGIARYEALRRELVNTVVEIANLDYQQNQNINTTLALIDAMNLDAETKALIMGRIAHLIELTDEYNRKKQEEAAAAQGAAQANENLAMVYQRLITSGENLIGASKDLDKTLKDVAQAAELGGPAVALMFIKWVEGYKLVQQRQQEMTKDFIENRDIILREWEKFGPAFVDSIMKAVEKGAIKPEMAEEIFKGLYEALGDVVPLQEILLKLKLTVENAEEAEKLKRELEKISKEAEQAKDKIADIMKGFLDNRERLGMFTGELRRINEIIAEMAEKGVNIQFKAQAEDLLNFIKNLNQMSIEINTSIQGFNMMSNVVGAVANAYRLAADWGKELNTVERARRDVINILRSRNQLTEEEIKNIRTYVAFLKEENAITAAEVATIEQLIALRIKYNQVQDQTERKAIEQEISRNLDDLKESHKDVTKEALEQSVTMERLGRIQQFAGMQGQFLNLALQAMQLGMLGAGNVSKQVTDFMRGLGEAMKDGTISAEEEKEMIKLLGGSFTESGDLAIDFSGMLNTLANTIQTVTDKVNSFITALNNIPRNIVVNITTNYTTTGGGGGTTRRESERERLAEMEHGGSGGSGGGSGPTTRGNIAPPYQHGAWRVPKTGPALIHEGEMILPAHVAEWFRQSGGLNVNSINIVVNAGGVTDARKLAEEVSREMVLRLRRLGVRIS